MTRTFTTETKGNASEIPSKGIDSWTRTIRNAYLAAVRTGVPHYVGATALAYFIETDEADLAVQTGGQLKVMPDGSVFKADR